MDLRIRKTYKALISAFTKLLEEHPYEDITIAMLCDEAMIRRTTFYKHFADKAAFFSFFVDSLCVDLERTGEREAKVEQAHDVLEAERLAMFQGLIDFLLEHERLVDNIFKSSMVGGMTTVMCNKVAEVISSRYRTLIGHGEQAEVRIEEVSQFAAGGIMRLLELWWERGHEASEEAEFISTSNALVTRVIGL